jgi:enoyl-[acyl-carrier-protein] reductase (NADH)
MPIKIQENKEINKKIQKLKEEIEESEFEILFEDDVEYKKTLNFLLQRLKNKLSNLKVEK